MYVCMYMCMCMCMCMYMYMYMYMCTFLEDTPNLPTNIIPAKIA